MSTRHHPFSKKPPSIDDSSQSVMVCTLPKGGSGKSSRSTGLSFEDEMALRDGKPQRNSVSFIKTLMEAGRPLFELKEYFMQTLGYEIGNPDDILRFEALMVDRFAMALSFEHEDVSAILAFMAENEMDIFPEGLESYELHRKAEGYYEIGQRGGKFSSVNVTHNADGSLRDLDAMNKYLQVPWDEYIPFLISDDKLDVVSHLAKAGMIDQDTLIHNILPFSGEKATRLRMAILGSDTVTAFEADERLTQVMIGAFPALSQKLHLIGSLDHLQVLVNDIHLPELAKAGDFLAKWGIHTVATAIGMAKGIEREWASNAKDGAQTKAVFALLKEKVPELHKHLGGILCDKPMGIVANDDYTETAFAFDFFREIVKRNKRNADGGYLAGNGTGHYHHYLSILETVDRKCLDELPNRLSAQELLLAYQLTRHKPLLKHLSAEHRDLAFNGDLGL